MTLVHSLLGLCSSLSPPPAPVFWDFPKDSLGQWARIDSARLSAHSTLYRPYDLFKNAHIYLPCKTGWSKEGMLLNRKDELPNSPSLRYTWYPESCVDNIATERETDLNSFFFIPNHRAACVKQNRKYMWPICMSSQHGVCVCVHVHAHLWKGPSLVKACGFFTGYGFLVKRHRGALKKASLFFLSPTICTPLSFHETNVIAHVEDDWCRLEKYIVSFIFWERKMH